MAPDLNSMPASPKQPAVGEIDAASVSASAMPPPPPPPPAPIMQPTPRDDFTEPMRHPRPLTAAELYLECEKEQEAVVNRLTRELSALRAQSASVASNTSVSSTSTSSLLPVDISDPNPTHQITGATHPTPSRHRSSSSVSNRSIPTQPAAVTTPARSLSRENSIVASSPASSIAAHAGTPRITSPQFVETANYRNELESVKAENDALRQRVRALERALQQRRRRDSSQSKERDVHSPPSVGSPEPRGVFSPAGIAAWAVDGGVGGVAPPRERSESQSTNTSSRRGLPLEEKEEIRFGESAGGGGVGRGG